MIKLENNNCLILKEITKKIKETKALGLYVYLITKQQNGIYYQTINEIKNDYKKASYKTIQKYLYILRFKYHLVEKYKEIYFINYLPQERI